MEIKSILKIVLTFTCRNDNIYVSEGDGQLMISCIIKRLVKAYQAKRLAKTRKIRAKHNFEQAQLMYNALGQRDY